MGIGSATHEPLGAKALWRHEGWQLPAGIQHLARDLMEKRGMPKSKAIQMAIGILRNWAQGKGNVTPKTRAAAVKILAEFDALRARAASARAGGSTRTSHPAGLGLGLATPAVMSGDGPVATVNANGRRVGRVKYTPGQRRAMAKRGHALADGSFPIGDRSDLVNAAKAAGRAHPSKRAMVKAHIRKRARQLGVTIPGGGK